MLVRNSGINKIMGNIYDFGGVKLQQLTKESAFHSRTSKLTKNFAVARDLWAATAYDALG